MPSRTRLVISDEEWVEACNIASGAFAPLEGFMDSADYKSVVEHMRLDNGTVWTIPVTLAVPEEEADRVIKASNITLLNGKKEEVAELKVEDVYKVDFSRDLKKIFLTDAREHPGVRKESSRPAYRVGGGLKVTKYEKSFSSRYYLSPEEARKTFRQNGWKTVAGFQTRNPLHRAHEYLQRVALEMVDGIFIHPLVGWKKADDFSPLAVLEAYRIMMKEFYPKSRAVLSLFKTPMRYAGPREAVFHAIIRRNFGCTHFIVGRDHAGVGDYYDKYAAHSLCSRFKDLGIEILALCGPYYCRACGEIVTEKSCPHGDKDALAVSGTKIRAMLKTGIRPPEEYMRKEISDVLIRLGKENKLFNGELNGF